MTQICFWTVATGNYLDMARSLVHSYHAVEMPFDFHVLTNGGDVEGAISHRFRGQPYHGFTCKLRLLAEEVSHWNYDRYVFLDADCVFLRNVAGEIQRLVCDVPCQIFTEHDFSDPALADKKWGRIKFPRILAIAREMGLSGTLFNTSGGYFAVSRQAVSNFVGLAFKFMRRFGDEGGYVTEEPGLSFAALSLCEQPSLYDYTHVHAIDCVRHHESYPRDERWTNRKWATGESYEVSPGILHAARGKRVLTEFGRRLGKDMCGLANSAESLSD